MLRGAGHVEIGRLPRRYWVRDACRDAVVVAFEREAAVSTS
jgi:hypothetical protein